MVEGDPDATANALFTVEFDYYNISRALASCKPPDVLAKEAALKEAMAPEVKWS